MATVEERLTDVEEEMEEQGTDIFKQQEQTINLLTDVLQSKLQAGTSPTYVTQAAPKKKDTPNYMMYLGGAFVLWILLKG